MTEYTLIGKNVPQLDGRAKITGGARFTDDLKLEGLLCGKLLRSPHAHARILNIDTSRAKKLKGVRAVITGHDTAGVKYGIFTFTRDQYFLPTDKVRYIGEEVAAVAAVDAGVAEEALDLIRVEYEPLPAVFDPEEAMRPGAPRIHDQVDPVVDEFIKYNVGVYGKREHGNVEEGFRQSDCVRRERFRTQSINHLTLEPYGVVARYDVYTDKVEVWCPNQAPFQKMRALANLLELPLNQVIVRKIAIGGAFGGRSETFPADLAACLLSKLTMRPVKIRLNREETFILRQKHPVIVDIGLGVKRDGTLMAIDIKFLSDGGAYTSTGPIATGFPFTIVEAIYRTPNIRYESFEVYTNRPVCGAMRGHGGQQMAYAMDSMLDTVAEEIGMDPVDIRLKNAIKGGERLPSDSYVRSCGFAECIEKARDRIGWREKHGKRNFRGVGMGCSPMISGFSMGFRTGSSAFIKFNEDAEATLITGLIDCGQGNETMAVQIASEILGIPMGNIRIICADTELTPADPGNYAMSSTFVSGNAVKAAAEDAARQILEIATNRLEISPEDLELKEGRVRVKGDPEKGMSIKEAIREGLRSRPVMGRGYYMPNLDLQTGWVTGKLTGQRTGAYTFGAVTAEVEVDPETGTVRVLKAVGAQDVGFALNPMAVEGQNEGSLSLGQGQALYEKIYWDRGLMLNPNFLDYQPPLATDMPVMETVIVEPIDQDGPFGAKEATETTNIAIVPAILNAIYDATGVRIRELPALPEKILEGIQQNKRREDG